MNESKASNVLDKLVAAVSKDLQTTDSPIGAQYYWDINEKRWQWAVDVVTSRYDVSAHSDTLDTAISGAIRELSKAQKAYESRA